MSLIKSASIVSAMTLASRVLGLVRELLVAATFGASATTDAFNVAFRIPNLLRRLFAEGAFSQAFVPVLAASRVRDGDEATQRLINQVATALFSALLLTALLGVLGAPLLVWLLASGLQQSDQAFDHAVVLTRIMFPYIAFMSLVALAAGVLNTWKRFAVPAGTPVLLNVAMIAAAWWGAPWLQARGVEPIYALAGGVMCGGVLQLAVQWWAMARLGLWPRLRLWPRAVVSAWRHEGVRKILGLMAPALLGVGVAQLSLLINTQIASFLRPGSVSWLAYADRLMEFPTAMLGVALGVVLTPQLSAARAQDDMARYSALLDWGLRWVLVLALPAAVALLSFTEPLVAVLYHYGAFGDGDVVQTAAALRGYGLGLLGLVAIKVLAPGYFAQHDMRTPVKIAMVVLVLTQVMNLFFVPRFAHAGLALSIGVAALINATWLAVGLLRSGAWQPAPGWLALCLKVVLALLVMAAGLWWARGHWDWLHLGAGVRVGGIAAVVGVAASVYGLSLWLMGVPLREFLRRAA
jgi:putative peptidoglycan lipid II flippase